MPSTHRNRLVTAISNTPGASGALTIASAASGYRTFGASDDGLSFDVSIVDGTAWEIRTGCIYTHAGTSLSRGTLEDSSVAGPTAIALTSAAMVTVTMSSGMGNSLVKQINPGSVYANNDGTTTQSVAASTFSKLTAITTEVFDQLGWYDAANQRFQPTRAGIYLVGCGSQITVSPSASVASAIILIRKNGTDYAHLARGYVTNSASANVGVSGSCLVQLNGLSDYVEPFVWHNDSVSRNTVAGAERQFFYASFWGE